MNMFVGCFEATCTVKYLQRVEMRCNSNGGQKLKGFYEKVELWNCSAHWELEVGGLKRIADIWWAASWFPTQPQLAMGLGSRLWNWVLHLSQTQKTWARTVRFQILETQFMKSNLLNSGSEFVRWSVRGNQSRNKPKSKKIQGLFPDFFTRQSF